MMTTGDDMSTRQIAGSGSNPRQEHSERPASAERVAAASRNADACPYQRNLRRLHLGLAVFVIALATSGFTLYFRKYLGLEGHKMTLIFVHAVIAYSLLAIPALRLILGIVGPRPYQFAQSTLRRGDCTQLFARSGRRKKAKFAGRSPLSRALATVIFIIIGANLVTGVLRAGADLYFPPFGPFVQRFLAQEGVEPALLKPGDRTLVDEDRYAALRSFKAPVGKIHLYGAIILSIVATIHVVGALSTEWSAPNDKSERGRARLMLFGPRRRQ